MGQINTFDINYYINKFHLKTFVETGSGNGDGISI